MGRALRTAMGGYVYHALNRGNGRATVFHKDGDYEAFERVMVKALEHVRRGKGVLTPFWILRVHCPLSNYPPVFAPQLTQTRPAP